MFVFKKRKKEKKILIYDEIHTCSSTSNFFLGGGGHLETNKLVECKGINAGISDGSGLVRS